MTFKSKRLLDEALRSPAEREALAGRLFDSLDTDDLGAESAWQEQIARRFDELDRGDAQPMSWAEARHMIFGDADGFSQD